jgi:hypothetical protein
VTTLDALPERVRDEVRSAVENGSYRTPMGEWNSLPDSLDDTDYVRYENKTYRPVYTVGDFWAYGLRLQRVE